MCFTLGKIMKNSVQRIIKLVGVAIPLVITIAYISWVFVPYSPTIEIKNSAGISNDDVSEVTAYAKSIGEFEDDVMDRLTRKSKWTPWNRGRLFIYIEGSMNEIDVSAGYYESGLSGGGTKFSGKRTSDGWTFSITSAWLN